MVEGGGGVVEELIKLRSFIHGGKDQHESCTVHHGEPLLCPCLRTTCNFFGYFFLGWVMLLHPQATSTDNGGPRTSDLSIERRRRNHFTTAQRVEHKLTIKNTFFQIVRNIKSSVIITLKTIIKLITSLSETAFFQLKFAHFPIYLELDSGLEAVSPQPVRVTPLITETGVHLLLGVTEAVVVRVGASRKRRSSFSPRPIAVTHRMIGQLQGRGRAQLQ